MPLEHMKRVTAGVRVCKAGMGVPVGRVRSLGLAVGLGLLVLGPPRGRARGRTPAPDPINRLLVVCSYGAVCRARWLFLGTSCN